MSLVSKLAEMEKANTVLTEQVAKLESEATAKDGSIADLTARAETVKAEHDVVVAEQTAKIEVLETEKAEAVAKVETVEADKAETVKELETAKLTLAAPAHAAAAAGGEKVPAEAGTEETPKTEGRDYIKEFDALEDGVAKSKWLKANGEALQEQYNATSTEE
jgi:hypothetical protein